MFEPPEGPWEIIPFAHCSEKDKFIDFLERPAFIRFLRQFKSDRKVMAYLRGVLTPPYQISLFEDDEVIELIAWKVAVHQLAIRLAPKVFGTDVQSSGSGQGGGGGAGGAARLEQQQKREKQQKQQQQQKQSDAPTNVAPIGTTSSRQTKSWFAITIVEEVNGAEKVAENITIVVDLTEVGMQAGTTSKKAPVIRFDDLNPGGAGTVIETSHEDVAWEVIADIE